MDWQGALRARIVAAATPAADRVYWLLRPQNSALPAVTLQTISEDRPQHFSGFDGLDASRVQADCWGTSYAQVRALAEAVIAAAVPENTSNGIRFSRGFVDSVRDLGEQTETAFIHRASIDLIIHHATA